MTNCRRLWACLLCLALTPQAGFAQGRGSIFEYINSLSHQPPSNTDESESDSFALDGTVVNTTRVTLGADVLIGSSDNTYLGTAIARTDGLLTWQNARDESIWFCQLDPQTGALIPADGKGTRVGTAASFVGDFLLIQYLFGGKPGTVNGPEWGNSQQGLGIYLTVEDSRGVYQQAKCLLRNQPNLVVEPFTSGGNLHRFSNLASQDVGDAQARVGFFKMPLRVTSPQLVTNTQPAFFQLDTLGAVERTMPLDTFSFNGPRWIPGEPAVTTFIKDSNGTIQVAKFKTDTGAIEFLTAGPEEHSEAEIVIDPTSGQQFMTCVEEGNRVAVYELQAGQWKKTRVVRPNLRLVLPLGPPGVFAVKPFIVRGKVYFFYNVFRGDSILGLLNPIDIYLGSGDGSVNQPLTEAGLFDFRLNPQYYIGQPDNQVHLYYYTSLPLPGIIHSSKFHHLTFTID